MAFLSCLVAGGAVRLVAVPGLYHSCALSKIIIVVIIVVIIIVLIIITIVIISRQSSVVSRQDQIVASLFAYPHFG